MGTPEKPALTEAAIRALAAPESFQRGQEYFQTGAVVSLVRRGAQLEADVEGSQYEPYRVRVTLGPAGIVEYDCTCPYDWGGACKHVVATLLAALHQPDRAAERPPVDTLLADLSQDQLRALVLALVEREPRLADAVEAQVQLLQTPPVPSAAQPAAAAGASAPARTAGAPRPRSTPLDPAPLRRQVRAALRSLDRISGSEAYYHVGGVVDEVRRLAEQARPYLDAGDGRNALTILEAVTKAYVEGWTDLDDSDGEAGALFEDLGRLWTEALLLADLAPAERAAWAERLAAWQRELDDYGVDDAFDAPQIAALQGWDDPDVQNKLRGATQSTAAPPGERARDPSGLSPQDLALSAAKGCRLPGIAGAWDGGDVTAVRLELLARQGRTQEYLNLAAAEARTAAYATMLARLGRVDEAVAYGLTRFAGADEAQALASALADRGALEPAFTVAEYGLKLHGPRTALATWLRDRASAAGQTERALQAALVVARESPSLAAYLAVQELAGGPAAARWPALRDELLARLDRPGEPTAYLLPARIEIYLHEGLVEAAIDALEASPYGLSQYALVERVADAALRTHPEWVERTSRSQAERIMDEGRSQAYQHAARWLERARAAAVAMGHRDEWPAYVDDLIARHKRKYSLVPLLKQVRAA